MNYLYVTLGIVGGIIALLFFLGYVGLPLLVYFTYKMKVTPQLYPFVPSQQNLLPETFQYLAGSYTALQKLGFDLLVCLKMPGAVESIDCSLALLVNRSTRDMAMITAIESQGETQTKYVEFVRRFRDGTVLQTNNSQQLSALPEMPGHTTFRLPPVKDPTQLFQYHCKLVASAMPRSEAVLRMDEEFGGDAIQYLLAVYPEALFDAEQRGLFYRPAPGDHFRATLNGAFRLSWQELWPISSLRKRARDRRAAELLGEV